MNITFGQVDFTEKELVEQFGVCNTLICLRMTNSIDIAKELSDIIWKRLCSQLPKKNYLDDFTIWVFRETKDSIATHYNKAPLTSSQVRRQIPRESLRYKQNEIAELVEDCDTCLGNLLLSLDMDSRILYVYKDICNLSYRTVCKIFNDDEHHLRKNVNRSRRKINNFLDLNCPLFNTDNGIKSDRARQIVKTDLPIYVKELRQNSHKVNIFKETENLLERKPFWLY